jgi:segregation and condensation protein B
MQNLVPAELGVGALRTLAAIALKKTIAQTDLIELRGSGAYQHIQELIALGFVQRRRQTDGRSYWLQVTNKFHEHFELEQLLPSRRAAVLILNNPLLLLYKAFFIKIYF